MKKTRKTASKLFFTPVENGTAFLKPDIFDSPVVGHFGHIDIVSPDVGIEGWALDCALPGRPLDIELSVGGRVVASARTERVRTDIAEILGQPCAPGFKFDTGVFDLIREIQDNEAPIRLAVAGRDIEFDLSQHFPTVGACKKLWVDQRMARLTREDISHSDAAALLDRLEHHAEAAKLIAERPLFPIADLRVGRIEAFHAAGSGGLWFVGWMRRDVPAEFPAVIVERRRYPSAAAIMQYERPDLPTDYVGVIGFFLSTWKPAAGGTDFHVYIDAGTNAHLAGTPSLRSLNGAELLAQVESVTNAVSGGSVAALRSLLSSGGNWLPNNARAAGVAAEAALDKLIVVPGFGAFVEGWAICPTRRAKGFALKIGECVLQSDPGATYFRERADLASVFPDGALFTARAGFGAVLRGPVTASDIGGALLKVIYSDGTSSVHAVDARNIRRFNAQEDSASLLQQWPALEHEPFFPAFARAVHRDWQHELQPPSGAILARARSALVTVLPQNISNLRVLFDQYSRFMAAEPHPESLVFVARRRETRSETLRLVNELKEERSVPASLFFLDDEKSALALLPHMLGQLGIERFVFLEQGLLPTRQGWLASLAYLASPARAPLVLEVMDPHGAPDRIGGAHGACYFGWNLPDFSVWYQSAAVFVPGPALNRAFRDAVPTAPLCEQAARRIEQQRNPRLVELVDAALHMQSGSEA